MTPNVAAFLTMTAHSEGVDQVRDPSGTLVDPYRVCYGKRHIIQDLNWHPHEERPDGSREWGGETLKDEYCIKLGLKPGCVSTAAGRYQITCPTWLGWKSVLALNDFGKIAQDDVAVQILKKQGALDLINVGRLEDAIDRCHPIWASLPGSSSGQPQTPLATLLRAYTNAGGEFA